MIILIVIGVLAILYVISYSFLTSKTDNNKVENKEQNENESLRLQKQVDSLQKENKRREDELINKKRLEEEQRIKEEQKFEQQRLEEQKIKESNKKEEEKLQQEIENLDPLEKAVLKTSLQYRAVYEKERRLSYVLNYQTQSSDLIRKTTEYEKFVKEEYMPIAEKFSGLLDQYSNKYGPSGVRDLAIKYDFLDLLQ